MFYESWLFLAIASTISFAFVNWLDAYLVRGVYAKPIHGQIVSGVFALLPLPVIYFMAGVDMPGGWFVPICIAGGFLVGLSYACYFITMAQFDDPALVIAMWMLAPALAGLAGPHFINESISAIQWGGLALVVVGGFGCSLLDSFDIKISKAYLIMVLASILMAAGLVGEKYCMKYGEMSALSAFFWSSVGMGLSALVVFISDAKAFKASIRSKLAQHAPLYFFSELFSVIGFWLMTYAIAAGPVALVISINAAIQPALVGILLVLAVKFFPSFLNEVGGIMMGILEEKKEKNSFYRNYGLVSQLACYALIFSGVYVIYM